MPKKSSVSGASVEGFSIFTLIGNTEDEKSFMHLSTIPEKLDVVLIVLMCKFFFYLANSIIHLIHDIFGKIRNEKCRQHNNSVTNI